MKNKLIILLLGKSSVGKDTLLNNLLRDEPHKGNNFIEAE